jgi:serine phosphatase RsbU (regulator of sigma subunit)/pSer/pThr/pTyr-binding forkhead associated (FHA) protein
MASLLVLKGTSPGQHLTLDKPELILGREAKDCDIVIANQAVSRVHARITLQQGQHYIEDLKSRNKTYVNNRPVDVRTPLRDQDRIKICDFLCTYQSDAAPTASPLPPHLRRETVPPDEDDVVDTPSTVQATLVRMPQHQLLETQPAERLRALIEISTALGTTLKIDELLPKIADTLLNSFRQADRCFVILREEPGDHLIARTVKTRRPQDEASPRFSRTIVRDCLENVRANLCEDASTDSKFSLAQSITDFRIRSVMCAPLVTDDGSKAVGVIQLDTQDRSKKFTKDDLNLLLGVANLASVALDKARLHAEQIQSERFQRDLELGEQVQRSFLPSRLPQVAGYQFFAQYKSALTIGGDYYDFIPLPDGKLGVLLGDVAGKGVPAALLMAKLSAEARFCMLTQPDPAAAVAKLNDNLLQAGEMDRFVTLAAVVLDPAAHRVTVINAGHMTPLVYRSATGGLEDTISNALSGLPLGIMSGTTYESSQVELRPGDCVLVFTDGVTDALSAENEPFQLDGIQKALCADAAAGAAGYTPEQAGKRLIDAVRQHAAGRAQNDDIALVCFGRLDPSHGGSQEAPTAPPPRVPA